MKIKNVRNGTYFNERIKNPITKAKMEASFKKLLSNKYFSNKAKHCEKYNYSSLFLVKFYLGPFGFRIAPFLLSTNGFQIRGEEELANHRLLNRHSCMASAFKETGMKNILNEERMKPMKKFGKTYKR